MPKEGRGEGLPPALRGARVQPDIVPDRAGGGGVYGKLSQLAEGGAEAEGGNEEQAAQLVMSAAQQLIQAGQLHPQIQDMVGRALAIIKSGVDELSGGGAGGGETELEGEPPRKRRRMKPPKGKPEEEEGDLTGGGMREMMGGY